MQKFLSALASAGVLFFCDCSVSVGMRISLQGRFPVAFLRTRGSPYVCNLHSFLNLGFYLDGVEAG